MSTLSLYSKTLELLQNRNIQLTFKKISEDTGFKESWLSMLSQGRITNPGVNSIQKLYEYLTKAKLKI